MNNLKSYVLAAVGILSLVASLTFNSVRANHVDAPAVVASTAHFSPGRTYLLNPANAGSQITCKVVEVDGTWIKCEDKGIQWVNTDTIMTATDR